jgi:hypothetical protein
VQLELLALVANLGHVDGVAVRRDGQVVRVGNVLNRNSQIYFTTIIMAHFFGSNGLIS